MVVLLDVFEFAESTGKHGTPVVGRNSHLSRLGTYELCHVCLRRRVDHSLQVTEAGYSGVTEALLQQTEAPVGRKLCVAHNEEGERDVCVESDHHTPDEVVEHSVILILPHTVVCV